MLVGMGKTNRTAALETKLSALLGEAEIKRSEIVKAEQLIAELPAMRERLWEIDELVKACEAIIRSDHPAWTRDHLKPATPFVHKIPVRFGHASKLALDVLRQAGKPMRVKDIAIEVLRREGQDNATTEVIEKVANAIGNALRKKKGLGYVETDGGYPALWRAVKPK